jgi:hypothetical protein
VTCSASARQLARTVDQLATDQGHGLGAAHGQLEPLLNAEPRQQRRMKRQRRTPRFGIGLQRQPTTPAPTTTQSISSCVLNNDGI